MPAHLQVQDGRWKQQLLSSQSRGNLSAVQTGDVPKGLEVRGGRREEESTRPHHQKPGK